MSDKPSIYFFCPAYNEEENLEQFIHGAVSVLAELSDNYLLTIVDDGSSDRTSDIADELAEKYENVSVIHHSENKGYGSTLITGFTNPEREKYNLIGYADSDGQIELSEVRKFLPLLTDSDAVIGWRVNRAEVGYRRLQSWVYNKLNKMLFGIDYHDFNCPFKMFKREVLEHMEIEDTSFFIDAEVVIKAKLAGYTIKEIEVKHYPRVFGKGSGTNPRLIFESIKGMVRFFCKHKTNRLKYSRKQE